MTEAISNFFVDLFGNNPLLATFLIAIIPLIELKAAIPFGMSSAFWGANALSPWMAFLMAFCGSIIVAPILALIFKPIVKWLDKYKFFHAIIGFFTESITNKSKTINEENPSTAPPNVVENRSPAQPQNAISAENATATKQKNIKSTLIKMLSVIIFVAFPVPLTGVWTGTCFAVLLELNFWLTCLSVIIGNLICGLIVTFICSIFPGATTIILYVFLALLVVAFTTKLVLHIVKKKKKSSV